MLPTDSGFDVRPAVRASIPTAAFRDAFGACAAVAPARSPSSVIQNVLMETRDGEAFLTATDMDVTIRRRVASSTVTGLGRCLLPADRVGAILRTASAPTVEIRADDDAVEIRAGTSRFNLNAGATDLFPAQEASGGLDLWTFQSDPSELRLGLRMTSFAADAGNTRYALGGVLIEPEPIAGRVLLVATDGRRVARVSLMAVPTSAADPDKPDSQVFIQEVLPIKAVKAFSAALASMGSSHEGAPAKVVMGRSSARLIAGDTEVTTRLVSGRFPAYRDVIPQDKGEPADATAKAFGDAAAQASVVASAEGATFKMALSRGLVAFDAEAADQGRAASQCPADYGGPGSSAKFNPKYVLEFAKLAPNEDTMIRVIPPASGADGGSAPWLFRMDVLDMHYVLMPIN